MSYRVGEKVLLSMRNIKLKRVKKKLDFRYLGPFEVIDVVGSQAYRLNLLENYLIYNVFYVSLLEPY
jgi:hypothetical protein